jgi:alpha-1,3-mannosyltransferase
MCGLSRGITTITDQGLIAPPGMGGLSVAHVVRQFTLSVGGLEDAVLNLARQQARRGLAPVIVTLDRVFTDPETRLPAEDRVHGLAVRRVAWRGSSRYPLAPSVLGLLRRVDLVHVHGVDFFFDYLAATRGLHRRPLVASTHGGFFHTKFAAPLKRAWFASITRASARAYDTIVACSENDAGLFAALRPKRLTTVENGVDMLKFAGARTAARDPFCIVTFGRFAAHKRITALFELLAMLAQGDARWRLVVAGQPADQDMVTLQDAVRRTGVGGRVRFRLAPTDDEIAAELAAATWFACASAHEGFGLAAVEAAAAGLIPILSDIPPFRRLALRLGDGVVFDPADALHAAALVTASLERGDLAQRSLAVAASAQEYDWRVAADKYLDVYAGTLQRCAQRALR